MEFILINDLKLKVMMTKSDLSDYDITAEKLDYSNTETKRILWDIIGRAKKSAGFCCDGYRVLVQLYTSRDGGCEIFISKLGASRDKELEDAVSLTYKPRSKNISDVLRDGIFGFDSLEWLLCVCRRLSDIGYSGESTAYVSDDHKFYLMLSELDDSGYFPVDEYSFISEYGSSENTEATLRYLSEHGKAIRVGDAVEVLSTI